MNRKLDIFLKCASLIGCLGAGWGVAELTWKCLKEKKAKEEVFDQFIDILCNNDGVDEIYW